MNIQTEVNSFPQDDICRLAALDRYKIVQTPTENAFDHITKLAAKIFNVPIAMISFVDEGEVFIKAIVGLSGITTAPREKSLCGVAVMSSEPLVIEDVCSVPWANCILAEYNLGIEFYASVPLITPDGFAIGTLCVMDRQKRVFEQCHLDILKDLAGVVMHELENRLANIEQAEEQSRINALLAERDARFRDIIQRAPVAIAVFKGRELIVESANDLIFDLWDKRSEEVLNKTLMTVLPELQSQPFFSVLDNVFVTGIAFHGNETRVSLMNDGKLKDFWFNFVYHPIQDNKGATERIMVIATDVTEMVEACHERQKVEDLFNFSVDAASIGTWHMDGVTREFKPSAKLKEFYGRHADEELSFDAALAIIDEAYRDDVMAAVEATITNGDLFNVEYPVRKSGSQNIRWLKGVGKMHYNTILKSSSFCGVVMDITEQKENLIRQNDFINMIGHELKSSLSQLKSDAQLINANAKRRNDLALVNSIGNMQLQIKKMSIMINGFRYTAQPKTARVQLDLKEFNIIKLLHEVTEETKILYPNHTVHVSSEEQALAVHADREKIAEVVSNFLINAIKYSKAEECINLDANLVDDQAVIGVKISCNGFNQQGVVGLFDYFQDSVTPSKFMSESGTELHQCAEIIKHHNGRVWVESAKHKGSASFFSLPLL